ncbi:MAG: hypothetical protein ACREHG_10540 [Candidatus Saccharimonadales bacterium]
MTDFRKRSGCFTSDGTDFYLRGISPFFRIDVWNATQAEAKGSGQGFHFIFYRGMNDGSGFIYTKGAATGGVPEVLLAPSPGPVNISSLEGNGFTIVNTGEDSLGPEIPVTAISTANIPVATNTGTNNLTAGSIVRFTNVTGAPQIAGIPFTVGNNTLTNTTFSIDYLPKLATAGTTATARVLLQGQNNNAKTYFITKIEKGEQTKVTFSITHNFKKGDRGTFFILDDVFGMSEINGMSACVVAVDTDPKTGNSITLDIDSRNFSDFTFPDSSNLKFTPAQFVPAGSCSTQDNQCCLCKKGNDIAMVVLLKAGKGSPAGQSGDKIYWHLTGTEIGCWGKK